MGRSKARFITLVLVFGAIAATVVLVGMCYADSKYYGQYNQCISESGGRGDYSSVIYACGKASQGDPAYPGQKGQNGCALWIGSAGSHGVPTIYASSATGTVNVAFWGMCTDKRDTTKSITVSDQEGQWTNNVGIVAKGNLTRGLWARPTSVGGTLDVATFIAKADKTPVGKCGMKYTRTVWVGREHSDGKSRHEMPETVSIIVPNPDAADQCKEEEKDLCKRSDWMPSGYARSQASKDYGETFIVVKARNTRIDPTMPSGEWTDLKAKNGGGTYKEEIYARPFDTIIWHSCYYPGVQTEAMENVSDIDGTYTAGGTGGEQYKEPRTDGKCESPIVVNYTQLWWGYENKVGGIWNNKYSFDKNELGPGYDSIEFGHGVYAWQAGFEQGTTYDIKAGSYHLGSEDVGNPDGRTQEARTYDPRRVDISRWRKPSTYGRYKCGETEEGRAVYCTCTNYYKNDIVSASMNQGVGTGGDSDHDIDRVKVLVPYNFENDTDLEVPKNEPVYSGEGPITVSKVTYEVKPRSNGITYDTYATIVPEAEMRLFMYVSEDDSAGGEVSASGDGCEVIENKQCLQVDGSDMGEEGTPLRLPLNGSEGPDSLDGDGPIPWSKDLAHLERQYNAFDASAGDYLCFVSAIWPASSGIDLQMDPKGDNMWKYSESKCRVIAKKPTFQVWGDSMYSEGNVKTYIGEKRNIYNAYYVDDNKRNDNWTEYRNDDKKDKDGNPTYFTKDGAEVERFGSWVEESLILDTGETTTLASGAATGISTDIFNYAHVGADNGVSFRNRSPLTFANEDENRVLFGNVAGKSGIKSLVNGDNIHELIDYWVKDSNVIGGCGVSNIHMNCKKLESATGMKIYYAVNNSSEAVSVNTEHEDADTGLVGSTETYLLDSRNGSVVIDKNIKYGDTYHLLREVPKMIIFAKDVYIKCSVSEVDAVIVATGTVNTCYDADGNNYNDPARQNQLRIFGTVMADKIVLGRTYGAAANKTGEEKDKYGIPSDGAAAEIFDYDSSLLLWSEFMSGSGESDTLNTVYQRELAPRY